MQYYNLNRNTIWKSLPWYNINTRIFIMQTKIYKASKSCKKYLLYKWQNKLLNSHEVKIIAIDTICQYISKYYLDYNLEKYNINDKLKFFLFEYVYCGYKYNTVINNLLENIKKYIIYLCIKPEWKAKLEPVFSNSFSYQKKYIFQERLINFFNIATRSTSKISFHKNLYYNHYRLIIKYIDPKYFINKLQSLPYINYCLQSWLDNSYIQNIVYSNNIIYELNNLLLYELIYKIIFTGIEWFNLKNIEIETKSKVCSSKIYWGLYFNIDNSNFININKTCLPLLSFIINALGLKSVFLKLNNYNIYGKIILYKFLNPNINILNKAFIIYSKSFLSNIILNQIKLIIYKKDLFGRWRVKKYLRLSKILLLFISKLLIFYSIFCFYLDIRIFNYIIRRINLLIVVWLRKKYKKCTIKQNLLNQNYLNTALLAIRENIIYDISILKLNR